MTSDVETVWDKSGKTPYLTRVKLSQHLRVHVFWRGDQDAEMHDHPSAFWTFPLVSYVEEVPDPIYGGYTSWRLVRRFRLHYRKATHLHRVLGPWDGRWIGKGPHRTPGVKEGAIVTFVWWGRKVREWGFLTEHGWTNWRKFHGLKDY